MKLDRDDSHNIESFGTLKEESFSIGDMGFVLEILRNKLYSNIKKAICQEYTSNARDAHREVGKGNIPIQVTLPSLLDPNWRCRDFGMGISPDRVSNIFVQYGVSTKRDSNDFTGSYGIGAKSAFGYSDSFIVNTFIAGIKRSYNAIIDESRRGKFVLLSETETSEPDGTEIVVPVRKENFGDFRFETERATRFWNPRPSIKDPSESFKYNEPNILLTGDNWFITSGGGEICAILDGIVYPIDKSLLDNSKIAKFSWAVDTYLKFNTGDLAVAANRESLDLNEKTKNKIYEGFQTLKHQLLNSFALKINEATTFKEANITFSKIKGLFGYGHLDSVEYSWNGQPLFGTSLRFGGYDSTVGAMRYELKGTNGANGLPLIKKATKHQTSSISFNQDCLILTTNLDFNRVVEIAVQKAFQQNPDKEAVWVVKVPTPELSAKLGISSISDGTIESYYNPKERQSSISRLTIYKLDSGSTFNRTSFKDFQNDTSKKVYVLLDSSKDAIGKYNNSDIATVASSTNLSVYGFKNDLTADKLNDITDEMQSFEDYIPEYIQTSGIDVGEILAYIDLNLYDCSRSIRSAHQFFEHLEKFQFQNGLMARFIATFKQVSDRQAECNKFAWLKRVKLSHVPDDLSSVKDNLMSLANKVVETYPLIKSLGFSSVTKDLIHYVNTVDTLAHHGYTVPMVKMN